MSDVLYRIADWQGNFENAKSRTIDKKSWCALPNKQDGLGYCMLMEHKNGAALYGAFVATVLMASKQPMNREGYLTDTGRIDGVPYTSMHISLRTRVPEKIVQEMLEYVSTNIGWIIAYDAKDTARILDIHEVAPKKEGRKEGRKGYCSDFEKAWELYPDKSGKQKAKHAYIAARNEGTTHDAIVDGINRYIAYVEHIRKNGFKDRRWQNGSTWFNGREWESEWTIEEISNGPSQEELNY